MGSWDPGAGSSLPVHVTRHTHVSGDSPAPHDYAVHSIGTARRIRRRRRRALLLLPKMPHRMPPARLSQRSVQHPRFADYSTAFLRPQQRPFQPTAEVSVSHIDSSKRISARQRSLDSHRFRQLGYVDELKRNYDFLTLFSVTFVAVGFLPGTFLNVFASFDVGGSAVLAIGWPICGLFMCTLCACLAELSSAWPVAGAMYSWTFILARSCSKLRRSSRFLSWLCGSFVLTGHLLAQMFLAYQFTIVTEGVLTIYDYAPFTSVQKVLLTSGVLVACSVVVVIPISQQAWLWRSAALMLLASSLLTIIAFFYSTPKTILFTPSSESSRFDPKIYVYILGWCLTSLATGSDAASHLAEDSARPSVNVPRALFWSSVLSYTLGYISIVCILLSTAEDASASEPRYYYAPTRVLLTHFDHRLSLAMMIILLINMFFQIITQIMSASRFTWALARDYALPFSSTIQQISKKHRLPRHATVLVVSLTIPFLFIFISNRQLMSNLILQGCGFFTFVGYCFPVTIYACGDRISLNRHGRGGWTMRKFSKVAAWISVVFSIVVLFIFSLPTSYPVTAKSFGWAPILFVIVFILTCLSWVLYGNSRYAGPIKSFTKYTMGQEVDIKSLNTSKNSHYNQHLTSDVGEDKKARQFASTLAFTRIATTTTRSNEDLTDSFDDEYYLETSDESNEDDEESNPVVISSEKQG